MCSECGKTFTSDSGLREHQMRERREFRHTYQVCGQTFISKARYTSHTLNHIGQKAHACAEEGCSATYIHGKDLKNHNESKHKQMERKCEKCGAIFPTNRGLDQHKSACVKGRQYSCRMCSYHTSYKGNLNRHVKNQHKN